MTDTAPDQNTVWISDRRMLLGLLFLIPIIACLLVPLFMRAEYGPAARRSQCKNNLKQIGLALYNYHDTYDSFPPAYVADENGRLLHSWRTLLLPFLDQVPLYEAYRFDETWDGPHNGEVTEHAIRVFNCPEETGRSESSPQTNYLAVVGPDTAWPEDSVRSLSEIDDDPSQTILVVEVAHSGIHWAEPRDVHVLQMAPGINPESGQGISSLHEGTVNILFCDGRVETVKSDLAPEMLSHLLHVDDGKPTADDMNW